jgi:cytochrome c-type biogenesis protein CcmH
MIRRALIASLAAVLCLAGASDPADRLKDPTQEARAERLFPEIRCVVCQSESIDDSEAELARNLRQRVRQDVAAGRTDAQIKADLVHSYGEFILLRPRFSLANAVLWIGPFALALVGLSVLAARRSKPSTDGGLTADEEARLKGLMDN